MTPSWSRAAVSATDTYLFLPALHCAQPYTGIHGLVTEKGAPASGIGLELRFYNGSVWSTKATAVTDAEGQFAFMGMPALGPNQLYYVLYRNEDNPNQLFVWATRALEAYAAGAAVPIGNFDIANIELLTPAPGASVGLPATFTWERRSAVPTDSYESHFARLRRRRIKDAIAVVCRNSASQYNFATTIFHIFERNCFMLRLRSIKVLTVPLLLLLFLFAFAPVGVRAQEGESGEEHATPVASEGESLPEQTEAGEVAAADEAVATGVAMGLLTLVLVVVMGVVVLGAVGLGVIGLGAWIAQGDDGG